VHDVRQEQRGESRKPAGNSQQFVPEFVELPAPAESTGTTPSDLLPIASTSTPGAQGTLVGPGITPVPPAASGPLVKNPSLDPRVPIQSP
jgi:hypothetical protein